MSLQPPTPPKPSSLRKVGADTAEMTQGALLDMLFTLQELEGTGNRTARERLLSRLLAGVALQPLAPARLE